MAEPKYRVGRDEHGLTIRDRQVRDLLSQGLNQPQIAERLGVNKQRVQQIVKKLRQLEENPVTPPVKVETVWAFLGRDAEGNEGVVSVQVRGQEHTRVLVTSKKDDLDELGVIAQVAVDQFGKPLELVRFTDRRHVKTVRKQAGS